MAEGGGMHGRGGMHGTNPPPPPPDTLRDTLNERAVRILLECILVVKRNHKKPFQGPFTLSVSTNAATTLTLQINLGLQPILGATRLVY